MSDKDESASPAPAKSGGSRARKRLVVLAVVVGVLAVAVVGGLAWHEQPGFCSTICHSTMTPYYESYTGDEMLVAVHRKAGITCLDCHEATVSDQVKELTAQVGGDYESPLRQREFKPEACAGDDCHGDAKMADMAEKTASLEPNPHENHKITGANCTACHNMHSPQETNCKECHTDFELTF